MFLRPRQRFCYGDGRVSDSRGCNPMHPGRDRMNRVASSNPKDRIGLTKVPLHYIPLSAQINQALAHLDGALKYGQFNWRTETVAATIYLDAALRHILKFTHGEDCDADSGVHHL